MTLSWDLSFFDIEYFSLSDSCPILTTPVFKSKYTSCTALLGYIIIVTAVVFFIRPGCRVPALPVIVLHLGQAVALGVPAVGGLVQLLAAQVVLVHLDDLVTDIIAVVRALVVGVLLINLVAVGIILEQGDATVKILHLDDLVLGVVPVIHLAAVRIALAGQAESYSQKPTIIHRI